MQLGPFYITPVLDLSHLGIDTNVFNTSGQQQSDFTLTAGPKINIAVPLRKFVLTADTVTDFVYFKQFENQRGVNFELNLRGEVLLRRVRFFAEDSFLNTRARPNFEIDVRARRKENAARAGVSIDIYSKLEIDLEASQAVTEYNDDNIAGANLARSLNRDAVAASTSIRYAVTPLTTISMRGEMRNDRFTFSPARNNDSWKVVPGVQFAPRAIVSGNAEVGYRSLRGIDASLPDFSGPVAAVNLSYKLLGSTTIGVTASREVEFSFELVEPYFVVDGYGASVRHQFTAPLGIKALFK